MLQLISFIFFYLRLWHGLHNFYSITTDLSLLSWILLSNFCQLMISLLLSKFHVHVFLHLDYLHFFKCISCIVSFCLGCLYVYFKNIKVLKSFYGIYLNIAFRLMLWQFWHLNLHFEYRKVMSIQLQFPVFFFIL